MEEVNITSAFLFYFSTSSNIDKATAECMVPDHFKGRFTYCKVYTEKQTRGLKRNNEMNISHNSIVSGERLYEIEPIS